MRPARPLVKIKNVSVDVEGRRILSDISLSISPGQHLGIIGGNGCGKSTLLALIAGMRWPAPGSGTRVYDFGSGPESDAVTARRRIVLVGHELQDAYSARGWNFRVRDIVHSGLTRTDIPQRMIRPGSHEQAMDMLEAMQLAHLADRRLLELSRGEQRRVLITRGLAFDPAVLLLDEPASGLDAASRSDLEETLRRAGSRTTIVTAAHRARELPAIARRTISIANGGLRPAATRPDDDPAETEFASTSRVMPDASGSKLIELKNASAWMSGRQVLKSIDWTIRVGENWMITGPNGAGKSTLLRMLNAGIRPARGGTIEWPGISDAGNVWRLRREIALVSPELQARYRFPTRVFDAVASGFHSSIGLVHRLTEDQRNQVAGLLVSFRLEDLADRLLSTLSYGQRHRTLIARTLATEPRILLLDEPWEGLDADCAGIVATELARRMQAGTRIICVSHIGARGLPLNRELRLENGQIVSVDGKVARHGSSSSAQPRASGSPPR
jgi:molybdate transport system ATP-binding protein